MTANCWKIDWKILGNITNVLRGESYIIEADALTIFSDIINVMSSLKCCDHIRPKARICVETHGFQ